MDLLKQCQQWHEQDKVKRLCNDLIELLEKKLANYLNQR